MQIKSTKACCFVLLENRTSDYETNTHTDNHRRTFPLMTTEAYEALTAFEKKMSYHRDNFLEGRNMRYSHRDYGAGMYATTVVFT